MRDGAAAASGTGRMIASRKFLLGKTETRTSQLQS
jgi:hypothetical protein